MVLQSAADERRVLWELVPRTLEGEVLAELKELLGEHPGSSEVFLHLGATKVLRLPETFRVEANNGLMAELRVLLGPDAVGA